ncbi:hypothetical protein [Candidatus Hodarchaeum mangrovi]
MSHSEFRCINCGYIPHESPVSGNWYCPKCGKRSTIKIEQPLHVRSYLRHKSVHQRSKDEIYNDIYKKLTLEEKQELGYKEPYINPVLSSVEPKKRETIRLFLPSDN